jgi:hypothetical protein
MRRAFMVSVAWIVAALRGAVLAVALAAPVAAWAEEPPDGSGAMPGDAAPSVPGDTPPSVEEQPGAAGFDVIGERIRYLHDRLRITPAQEGLWTSVAQVMRVDAKVLAPLLRLRRQPTVNESAPEAIGAYERLGEAQLDGLKKFQAAFQPLYEAMSDTQKHIADILFRTNLLGQLGGVPELAEHAVEPPPEFDELFGFDQAAGIRPGFEEMPLFHYHPGPLATGPVFASPLPSTQFVPGLLQHRHDAVPSHPLRPGAAPAPHFAAPQFVGH